MTVQTKETSLGLSSRLVNSILAIKPLANFARVQARKMMINRAESLEIPWRKNVNELRKRDWKPEWDLVVNSELKYPKYYDAPFHAYPEGNLSWETAWEVESIVYTVHAKIWPEAGKEGDNKLRQSYHQVLQEQLKYTPQNIVDLGCGIGMSTMKLQELYDQAQITGIDLSPYFLAVANYRSATTPNNTQNLNWLNVAAEATGLPDNSCDLVSACLLFHELPSNAVQNIVQEIARILKPGGHFAIMDINPQSEAFLKMPAYIVTLLKSTEPYLDQYLDLNWTKILSESGFTDFTMKINSPRHRTIIAELG